MKKIIITLLLVIKTRINRDEYQDKKDQYSEVVMDSVMHHSSSMRVVPVTARSAKDRKPSTVTPFRNGLSRRKLPRPGPWPCPPFSHPVTDQ